MMIKIKAVMKSMLRVYIPAQRLQGAKYVASSPGFPSEVRPMSLFAPNTE